ncbi:MAG: hypothetical protein KDD42_09200, partial [Bdellovibrionales bacterium]|nr:hypothetical protein [Bdellovibrionales bacterium]
AGLAFALSSGTLGAALEASLYRVPAIAFSAQIPADLFKAWNQGTPDHSRLDWQRLGQIAAHHTFSVLQNGALSQCKVLSINYPWSVSEETPCLLTSVKRAYFRPLFIKLSENVYRHSFQGFEELAATNPRNSSELPYDIDVLEQEQVSMTAFDHFMEEVRHQNLSERISQLQAGRLSSCEGGEVD